MGVDDVVGMVRRTRCYRWASARRIGREAMPKSGLVGQYPQWARTRGSVCSFGLHQFQAARIHEQVRAYRQQNLRAAPRI